MFVLKKKKEKSNSPLTTAADIFCSRSNPRNLMPLNHTIQRFRVYSNVCGALKSPKRTVD